MSVNAPVPETVTLPSREYMRLLVAANDLDPAHWPEGAKHGAALLVRIRELEALCSRPDGTLDWDALAPELEAEYESRVFEIENLIEPYAQRGAIPAEQVFAELGIDWKAAKDAA